MKMNRDIAFLMIVLPCFLGFFFVLTQVYIAQGLLTIGSSTNAKIVFFLTYIFAFFIGVFTIMLFDELVER